jgi:(R)-2-hydroxyacyl-CoA dehydratese activating ATPase
MTALGIDVGSTTTKLVAVDAAGVLGWHLLESTHPRVGEQVARLLARAHEEGGVPRGTPLTATGYGRRLVTQAEHTVTEITCHARGVFRILGRGGTLVDIGGQDSKVIVIGADGGVFNFSMNDKCAAGTGRFLENTAQRLHLAIEEMGPMALSTTSEVPISSTCTVFAESEIISMLAHGEEVARIVRGLHRSLVRRVLSLIRSTGLRPPLLLSGGVVQNPAVRELLAEETGEEIILPPHPQLMGAYGAALIGLGK